VEYCGQSGLTLHVVTSSLICKNNPVKQSTTHWHLEFKWTTTVTTHKVY